MKKMSGIMSEAIKITSDVIGKNADASQEINVYELFQGKVLQNQQNIALFCIKGKNHYFFKFFKESGPKGSVAKKTFLIRIDNYLA